MKQSELDWQLAELTPGCEILVKDREGKFVARGVLRSDRESLLGPNGEYISLKGHSDWTIMVKK
jgi:nitrate reductase NapAB chaperone NapD